jgi:hypothetical protein
MLQSTNYWEFIVRTKKTALFLLCTIYLTACGGITPLPPTETSPPISTSTKTGTPYPTSAYELTQTAFESLMKNVCPTATPYPVENNEFNSISSNEILREFAGNYSHGNGFWIYVLNLNCDGSFYKTTLTDTGGQFVTQGNLEVQNEELLFKSAGNNSSNTFIYIPIRWGQRKYLLEKDDGIERFCEALTTQETYKEPRNEEAFWGLFYLRIGDTKLDATGSPSMLNGREICI